MTPTEFKTKWNPDEISGWIIHDLKNLSFNTETMEFLKNGLPENVAPYLSFVSQVELFNDGLYGIGSDGAGNPIAIDSKNNDRIVLLDHELGFKPIHRINKNVIELSKCLLEFKIFIEQINSEFGEDGFYESKFSERHISELKRQFEKINPKLFTESEFWKIEFENLYYETE